MEERKYFIDAKQLRLIDHYKRMFELNADSIKDLCSGEKDDVVYGFELGKMHSHLRDCFHEMSELEQEIKEQEIKDTKEDSPL